MQAVTAPVMSLAARMRSLPRATLIAILILIACSAIAFGFVLQRGGILLPEASSAPVPGASAAP